MQCLILAGGYGTRLNEITENTPKSMVCIDNKPFLEYQIDLLKKNNITNIILCVGHLHEQIIDYFGDGSKFGVKIKYSFDDSSGTWVAVRNAKTMLEDVFFILYGDAYLELNYLTVVSYFLVYFTPALMTFCLAPNRDGNINVISSNLIRYDKRNNIKPYTDYGLICFSKKTISEFSKHETDLADILNKMSMRKRVVGYYVNKRFHEIGSVEGLNMFTNYIRGLK